MSTAKTFKIALFLLMVISVFGCNQSGSSSTARTIDFEVYPSGDLTSHFDKIDTDFSPWGISHITSEDDDGHTASAIIGQYSDPWLNYPSGVSALAPWPGDGTYYGKAQAPITVYFNSPIDYFSVIAMDVGYNGLSVKAYDNSSFVIASTTIDGAGRDHSGIPGGNGLDFIEFSVSGISKIIFSQIHGPDWDRQNGLGLEGYLLDDMSFIY